MKQLHFGVGFFFFLKSSAFLVERVVHHQSLSSRSLLLKSSPKGDNNEDYMRKLLEDAWNAETMGEVPTSVDGAADAAVTALKNAMDQTVSGPYFLDISLPQQSILAGTNVQNEASAVSFGIAVSERLNDKALIIVKDRKCFDEVSRALNLDGQVDLRKSIAGRQPIRSSGQDENGNVSDGASSIQKFADEGSSTDNYLPGTEEFTIEIEDFRSKLSAGWIEDTEVNLQPAFVNVPENSSFEQSSTYRLTSLFGDAVISDGSDMALDVTNAVAANALPLESENTIIVIAGTSNQEVIAVRALANRYTDKTILLMNFKPDPMPTELGDAQTIYSFLPLRFQPADSAEPNNYFRVVVLRRYPRDWELYLDKGRGFHLIASVQANSENSKGVPKEWVNAKIQSYLKDMQ